MYTSNLKLTISGKGAERILSVLPREFPGILITDVKRSETGDLRLTARNVRSFRALRKICVTAGLSCELTGEFGAGARLRKLRGRYALWIAPLMLAAALYYASCFVWQIDVSGNENISASDILGALESEGFEAGTYYPGLDTALLANQILAKFPELSFFAVNLHGSRAEVIVREYTPAPEMIDENSPCDITASESGTILKLRVFEGSPAAAAGDRVVRGQTLIYGKGVHALGEAEAEVIREKTIAMPLKYYAKVYSGEELRQNYVKFGNLRLNLYFGTGNYPGKCDILVSEKRLKLFSFELPFVRGQIRASFYERGERTLTAARAAAALRARFDAELDNLPAGVAVIDVSYKASRKDGMVMMTQTLRTHQQIGTENGN